MLLQTEKVKKNCETDNVMVMVMMRMLLMSLAVG